MDVERNFKIKRPLEINWKIQSGLLHTMKGITCSMPGFQLYLLALKFIYIIIIFSLAIFYNRYYRFQIKLTETEIDAAVKIIPKTFIIKKLKWNHFYCTL